MNETIACSIFWNPLARQTSSSAHIYMYPWRSRWSLLIFKPWGQRSKAKLLLTLKSILYSASLEPFAFLLSTLQISFSCSILPHESEACLHISDTFIVPLKMPLLIPLLPRSPVCPMHLLQMFAGMLMSLNVIYIIFPTIFFLIHISNLFLASLKQPDF